MAINGLRLLSIPISQILKSAPNNQISSIANQAKDLCIINARQTRFISIKGHHSLRGQSPRYSSINTRHSSSKGMFTNFTRQNSAFLCSPLSYPRSSIKLNVEASVIVPTTVIFVLQVLFLRPRFLLKSTYSPSQVTVTTLTRKNINKNWTIYKLHIILNRFLHTCISTYLGWTRCDDTIRTKHKKYN